MHLSLNQSRLKKKKKFNYGEQVKIKKVIDELECSSSTKTSANNSFHISALWDAGQFNLLQSATSDEENSNSSESVDISNISFTSETSQSQFLKNCIENVKKN